MTAARLALHPVPSEVALGYLTEGAWDDRTLGRFLDDCLAQTASQRVRIWSATHPYQGPLSEVRALARQLAKGLRRLGVQPGDVVAFQLPNWLEAAVTFYAAAMLGTVLVPIVHFYGPKEVGFILRQSRARTFVVVERFGSRHHRADLAGIEDQLPDLQEVVVVSADPRTPRGGLRPKDHAWADLLGEPLEDPVEVDPDQAAVIGYTSGTTADPKGVVHTHRSICFETRQLAEHQLDRAYPNLTGAPVGHAIGMLSGLLVPLCLGRPFYLIDVWEPEAVLRAMVEENVSAGSGSTYFFTSLLDAPSFGPEHVTRMDTVGLGGSPIPDAVADRAEALGVSIVRAYGSTEHPSVTGSVRADPPGKRLHTDGRPLPFVEIRTVDEGGRDTGIGHPGEILTRGPDRFAGYTDESLTMEALDAEGWFRTGDVGVIDEEGFLTVTDRVKDIIIRGGENVSAAEVEQLLAKMPGVAEVAVVAAPDERLGEHGCAFFRMQPGTATPSLEEVQAHLGRAGLARQKWPEELRQADELPRTPSGKVQKFLLRRRLREAG